MLYRVKKRFTAEGRMLEMNSIIDASKWRNTRMLLEHGFIEEASSASQPARLSNKQAETNSAATPPKPLGTKPTVLRKPGVQSVPVIGKVPVAAK